jgi:hypothetical protein
MMLTPNETALMEACELALADLQTRHDMDALLTHADGSPLGPCSGCGTCKGSIPALEKAIAAVKQTWEVIELPVVAASEESCSPS